MFSVSAAARERHKCAAAWSQLFLGSSAGLTHSRFTFDCSVIFTGKKHIYFFHANFN